MKEQTCLKLRALTVKCLNDLHEEVGAREFKAVHKQTRETILGTWDELSDLDNRVWDLVPVPPPESHSVILSKNPIAFVLTTYTNHNYIRCTGYQPIYSLQDLSKVGRRDYGI